MTRQQARLYGFICRTITREGCSPSFDEMRDHMGFQSKSNVHRLVAALEEQGLIRRFRHRARGIEVIDRAKEGAPPSLVEAAKTLLSRIHYEDPARGVAVVDASALGDLDIAVAEIS